MHLGSVERFQRGDAAFLQPFDRGTNILAIIPGRELPDEYVIVGAHYDHTGSSCRTADPTNTICNGATDNATGVAAVLAVGERLALVPGGPRRSVVLALWDAEEDGLRGSRAYVDAPLVPLEQTVAYVNLDIQGANLLPSLREYAQRYQVNGKRMALARPGALLMHPGPINEGVEVAPDVADGAQSVIEEQVRTGVAVRVALLYLTIQEGQR